MDTARLAERWNKRHWANLVRGLLVVAFVLMAIWAISLQHFTLVLGQSEMMLWLTTALVSVGPELAGIAIGVVSIDLLNERRQREEHKRQLIRELASPHNEIAVTAARELREEGWLTKGAELRERNLSGANLAGCNLSEAKLEEVNLQGADLGGANLYRATLRRAMLESIDRHLYHEMYWELASLDGITPIGMSRTDLGAADLRQADLRDTNMNSANFYLADLRGANLEGATLQRAVLEKANLEGTNLCGSDLTDAFIFDRMREEVSVIRVYMRGAIYDARTRFPSILHPKAHGAILVDASRDWTTHWLAASETLEEDRTDWPE